MLLEIYTNDISSNGIVNNVRNHTRKTKIGSPKVEYTSDVKSSLSSDPPKLQRRRKIYHKLRNNPSNVRFNDFGTAVMKFGFELLRHAGSHKMFKRKVGPKTLFINMQPDKRDKSKAKTYQVKEFISMIDDYKLLENE